MNPTEEIKAKLDIIDLVNEYFPLKQAGVNFKACCPFHEEKTPSFMVNRERQFYHCFGCNESGDIFTFIQKMENIEFPEALRILAVKAGVKLPEYNPKMQNLKTRLLDMQSEAAEWFAAQLKNSQAGQRALGYLKQERELKDETIKEWQLGYALDSWEALSKYLKSRGYTNEEILQSGLVAQKQGGTDYYDRFRARIMFPIKDYHGSIVGFTGRALPVAAKSAESNQVEVAKYINSPQSLIYNKSEVIFGLFQAKEEIKKRDKVVIVEGNMDVIASHQGQVKNVVAISGTALTAEQVKTLQRYTNNIVFCFDADEAGIRAVRRSIELAWSMEANVRVAAIDKEVAKDPDELVRKDAQKWRQMAESAPAAMDYFFDLYLARLDKKKVESKKEVAKELLNLIVKLESPIERDHYTKRLAGEIDVAESALREALDKVRKQTKTAIGREKTADKGDELPEERKTKIDRADKLMAYMAREAEFATYISENLELEYLPPDKIELYKALVVYYTKHYLTGAGREKLSQFIEDKRPDLLKYFNRIFLIADDLGDNYFESMEEIKKILYALKKFYGREKTQQIEKQIKNLEERLNAVNDKSEREEIKDQLSVLLKEFDQISFSLR